MEPKHVLRDIREFFKRQKTIGNEISAGGKNFDKLSKEFDGVKTKILSENNLSKLNKLEEKIHNIYDNMKKLETGNTKKLNDWKTYCKNIKNADSKKYKKANANVARYEKKLEAINKKLSQYKNWIEQLAPTIEVFGYIVSKEGEINDPNKGLKVTAGQELTKAIAAGSKYNFTNNGSPYLKIIAKNKELKEFLEDFNTIDNQSTQPDLKKFVLDKLADLKKVSEDIDKTIVQLSNLAPKQ